MHPRPQPSQAETAAVATLGGEGPLDLDTKCRAMEALIGAVLPASGEADHNCLLPGHDDESPSMSVAATGLFYCPVCDVGGDVADLVARREGLDTRKDFWRVARLVRKLAAAGETIADEAAPPPATPGSDPGPTRRAPRSRLEALKHGARATSLVLRYSARRGISVPTLLGARASIDEGERIGVRFPLTDESGQSVGTVTRYIDDEVPRYHTTLTHKKKRGLLWTSPEAPHPGSMVVITEGVFDALTAAELGLSSASLPGGVRSAKDVAKQLASVAALDLIWIVAIDGDDSGDKAADVVIGALAKGGANDIRRVRYPTGTKDLNEVLVVHGAWAVVDAIETAVPVYANDDPRSWLDPPDWITREDPPRPWLVEPIIRLGDRVLLIGQGDSLKTHFTRQLAIAAVSDPADAIKLGTFAVTGGCRVLIVNEELPADDARRMLRRFAMGNKLPPQHLARVSPAHQVGFVFGDDLSMARLAKLLRSEPGPWVVVVDSFRHVLGDVDENLGSAVAPLLRSLDAAIKGTAATLIIIAHEAKGHTSAKNAMAGSSAPYAWIDTALRFERKDREPVTVSVIKGRNLGRIVDPFRLDVVDTENAGLKLVSMESSSAPAARPKLSKLASRIRGALARDVWMSRNELRKTIGKPTMKYDTLDPALAALEAAGLMTREVVGKEVRVRLAGPAAAAAAEDPGVEATGAP